MAMTDKVECTKCLGTSEFFNGFKMKKCDICEDGETTEEMAEAYTDSQIVFDE